MCANLRKACVRPVLFLRQRRRFSASAISPSSPNQDILIPQIEVALRSIAHEAGLPVTKAHPKVPETSVAIGMGDILYQDRVTAVLGPNMTLHLQALFADPRGLNLRNEMAHGLLGATAFDGHTVRLLIHCLLVLGLWKEFAGKP
ncbi:DUF4209 domain-containing protein [Bradyrhizobium genosp. P]|uniref:DUF4209 domain-containing protein n=1 Tax=Bradyrhizobium genosp. P TaxID=83641 RepID=UPI003CF82F7A